MTTFFLGICPNNLNGNHRAWCHSVEGFDNPVDREVAANQLNLDDTCDRVFFWEEDEDEVVNLPVREGVRTNR